MFIVTGALLYTFFICPDFILKYIPFIFAVYANIAGVASCEFQSVALDELSITSYFAGSLPLIVFSRWVFLSLLFLLDRSFGVQNHAQPILTLPKESPKNVAFIAFEAATFILVVLLFVHVLPNPSFIAGLNRFNYSKNYFDVFWTTLRDITPYLIIFPIIAIRYNQRRKLGIATILIYCLFLFWTGHKFGGFFAVACMFCYAYVDKTNGLSTRLRCLLCGVLTGGIIALIGFSLFSFSLMSNVNPTDYLAKRFAEQGQLWWKTYDQTKGTAHLDELPSEIEALVRNKGAAIDNVGSSNGIYRIMYFVAPASKVDKHLQAGARYTEGGYPAAYYYFGPSGPVLFSLIAAVITFLIQNALIAAIWTRNPFRLCIFTRLSDAARTGLRMFLFHKFTSKTAIASYVYLAIEKKLVSRYGEKKHAYSQSTFDLAVKHLLEIVR